MLSRVAQRYTDVDSKNKEKYSVPFKIMDVLSVFHTTDDTAPVKQIEDL